MNFKKRIGYFFTMTCTSFTIIMLLYAALSGVMNAPVGAKAVYALFAVCAMVSLVIVITSFIPIKSEPVKYLINFIDVFLTVFLFGGGVLGVFPFTWNIMLIVFGMLSAAYVGVVVVLLVSEQITASDINKKISEMKKQHHEEDK
ncbi:MAG: hypothetical protein PUB37_07975 [Firmicutes bacterium]|nr:hypothetical protein [Bacillota bacterium]